jgi:hypothetical protein
MGRIAKLATIVFAASSAAGCATVLRGGDADREVHLHLTYFMARAAGFDEREARDIAAADCYTDEHPETNSVATERRVLGGLVNPVTIPRIVVGSVADCAFGAETPKRGFGRRTAEATAWALSPLAHRLHFPALGMYERVEPAFVTDARTGEIYYNNREAIAVLEQAFRALETRDPDAPRALALLGIGLHTLQDSYKHRGFCGALGHIGVSPDPDDISRDLGMALEIAEATLHSLRYARGLLKGGAPPLRADWKGAVERLYAAPLRDGESRQDRWTALIRGGFGDDYGAWEEWRGRWMDEGGGAFDRALDRVRAILR